MASQLNDPTITPITVQYWRNGNDDKNVYTIDILETKTVSDLKEKIAERGGVATDDLNLYHIPNPSDDELEDTLKTWNPTKGFRLNGRTKLSTLRSRDDDKELFVVVDEPNVTGSRVITLNCWLRGQDLRRVFAVKISRAEVVSILKEVIKDKKPVDFRHMDADALVLYKACLPCSGTTESLSLGEEDVLEPTKMLSYYYPEAPYDHIHVVIEPPLSVARPSVAPTSLARRLQDLHRLLKPPSEKAEPSKFKHIQSTDAYVDWTRPSVRSLTPPVTLLHSIFGQFVDDCHEFEPTCNDNMVALKLSSQLSDIFPGESDRTEAITEIFRGLDIHMISTAFSGCITDGDLQVNGRRYMIMEVKNEIGSKGAEPYFQAILYYARGLEVGDNSGFNFPCLIVTHFGGHLSFSGAVVADRVKYQILSTCLPLFSHPNDSAMRKSIARHIGAFRVACKNLKSLYEKFGVTPSVFADLQPAFPYPRSYTNSDGEKVHFTYQSALQGSKLLFVVRTAVEELCIKFTQKYSVEVHQQCAALGISPQLLGHDVLPGGWHMISMDYLERYDCLFDVKGKLSGEHKERVRGELRSRLTALHQRNFVHGDVRDANVMISKDGSTWRLIDFEWSGKIGEVRYPMNVNRSGGLRRPEGAKDGELIIANHDIEMLDYLF